MDKILHFFKKNGIKYEYIGTYKKIGIKKDNSISNTFAYFKKYNLKAQDELYILFQKVTGRNQYLLYKENDVFINVNCQNDFLKKAVSFMPLGTNEIKKGNAGAVFKEIRIFLKMKRAIFAKTIHRSEITVRRHENGTLAMQEDTMLLTIMAHDLNFKTYTNICEKIANEEYLCSTLHKKILFHFSNNKGGKMSDFLTADEVATICKIKIQKAYKIIKQINDEMSAKGYIVIRGRVNKKFFMQRVGLEENYRKER